MADVRPATTAGPTLRVTEILAGLSLTTDLATAAPMETGLGICAVATRSPGPGAWTPTPGARCLPHTALLGAVGCTSTLPDGGRFADEELHLWTFDDAGRVTRYRHYVDTAKHIAAASGVDTTAAE